MCTIGVFTDVEADSPEQAKELAEDRGMVGLCYQCATGDPAEEWCTSGELDGIPSDLDVEENS
jgi:hypothetical protein